MDSDNVEESIGPQLNNIRGLVSSHAQAGSIHVQSPNDPSCRRATIKSIIIRNQKSEISDILS